jgi:hypothetical protein
LQIGIQSNGEKMAFTVRNKSSSIVFNTPSYLPTKKQSISDKVDKLIQETIQEKIFNLLNIDRRIHIKSIEYFTAYKACTMSNKKVIASFSLRLKGKADKKFKVIYANEIEISGITPVEFHDFLNKNNTKKIKDNKLILDKI